MEKPPSVRSTQETSAEYVPTKEKILEQLTQCCEGATTDIAQELRDEKGIYRLEVWGPTHDDGTRTMYGYLRTSGPFDIQTSPTTRIYAIEFDGEDIVGGRDVAEYDPQTQEWKVEGRITNF